MVDKATKAALALKTCKNLVREGSKQVKCGNQYLGNECTKKDVHLLKFKTGFCSNGWCEGTKPTDWKGNAVPTCKFYMTCPCKCHDEVGKLFEATETERILVDASGYSTPARTYWMPSDDPLPPLSTVNGNPVAEIIESPAPDRVPTRVAPTFTPTPTGRAARGELESWVEEVCNAWLVDEPDFHCTPAFIAEEIAKTKGITPPSVGAIGSVFNRWVELGFAECAKKPVRFVRYTEDGLKLGLAAIKERVRRQKKLQESAARRGYR